MNLALSALSPADMPPFNLLPPEKFEPGEAMGRGVRDGEPFADKSGRRRYIRDKRGTIRRLR